MSLFDAIKMFSNTSVNVTLADYSVKSEQGSDKIRKMSPLFCLGNGHFYLPKASSY